MALLDQQQMYGSGMVKEIEGSAIQLVLQNLQQDQYQYPIKSFIREIASNCVDAIEEKKVARSIITGESKVEEHYSTEESDLTKDSKFDPSYYNLDFLSEEDIINITYVHRDRETNSRDQIIIEDSGVGLGGKRLMGYFRPAYSTRRLSKASLGKFGVGAKAGLATGVESYQIVSRHNGREYHFDIYNDRFFSTVPKFNEQGENPHEIWKAKRYTDNNTIEEFDNIIYYQETTEPNGLKVIIDVKNPIRNKSKYIDAVKSQLTYFDYVRLFETWESGWQKGDVDEIHFKTEVLYRDEHLIIPKDNYYAVPHLVLNGVNYNVIDFAEMEMDEKKGNIGIIGDPSEIDVNQSRESVRYTEKTRNSIKKYLANSILVAQNYIEKEVAINQDDFLKWALACRDIKSKNSRDNIFSRLSGLADLTQVEFTHEQSGFKYNSTNFKRIFDGFRITRVDVSRRGNAFTTNTSEVHSWESFTPVLLFYRESSVDRLDSITAGYIWENLTDNNPIYIITPELTDSLTQGTKTSKIIELIQDSGLFKILSDVDVPESFKEEVKEAQETIEKEEKERIKFASMSEKELRKKNGDMLYHSILVDGIRGYNISEYNTRTTREEVSIDNVPSIFTPSTTVYGTKEDLPLLKSMLHYVGAIQHTKAGTSYSYVIGSESLKVIMVSKEAVKYIDSHATHVKKAIQDIQGTKINIMKRLRDYNTAKKFKHIIRSEDFMFLGKFAEVDEEAYNTYTSLCTYIQDSGLYNHYSNSNPGAEEVDQYLESLAEFQLFVNENSNKELIAIKAKEMFNNRDITSCDALDLQKWAEFKALEDYISDMKDLLSPYSKLTNSYPEVFNYAAIREYIRLKAIPNFEEFKKIWYDELKVEEYLKNTEKQIIND